MRKRIIDRYMTVLFIAMLCVSVDGIAQEEQDDIVVITRSALIDNVIIDKKPILECRFAQPPAPEALLVFLDGTDVTALLQWRRDGFVFQPPGILPAGEHTLQLLITSGENELEREFAFASRHTENFTTLQSSVELGAEYAYRLLEKESSGSPSSLDATLGIDAVSETAKWEHTFSSHLHYADPALSDTQQYESLELNDFLLRSRYRGENGRASLEAGEISIDESENTFAHFSRRGVQLNVQYKGLTFNTFSVLGERVYGFHEGTGIGTQMDKNILGVSLAQSLWSGRAYVKLIYAKGGMHSEGLGTGALPTLQSGNVLGVTAGAELIESLLSLNAEWDASEYDDDTDDAIGAKKDHAYKAGLGGSYGIYQYLVYYTYAGAAYTSLGNLAMVNDKEGIGANFGLQNDVHSVSVTLSQLHDNTDDDAFLPRVYTDTGSIDYAYMGFDNWQMSFNYIKTVQRSEAEPAGTEAIETQQDEVGANVGYNTDAWAYAFCANYVVRDDKHLALNDQATLDISFAPSYAPGRLYLTSITPTLGYIREEFFQAGTTTQSYAINLNAAGHILNERMRYSLDGTLSQRKGNANDPDESAYAASARLEYLFKPPNSWLKQPSTGLKGNYKKVERQTLPTNDELFELQLFVNLPMSYVF